MERDREGWQCIPSAKRVGYYRVAVGDQQASDAAAHVTDGDDADCGTR